METEDEGEKDLWLQNLPNLKRLDLHGSRNLIKIPDLAQCPKIEEVILSHCTRLAKVYSSSFLSKLKCAWFNGCDRLWSLLIPSNILSTTSGLIVLHNCRNLEMFSVSNANTRVHSYSQPRLKRWQLLIDEVEKVVNTLEPLDCADDQLYKEPKDNKELLELQLLREGSLSSFPSLNVLCWLDLSDCESLTSLPIDLFKLKFLKRLYLWGCSNLEEFPEIEETMENLTVLILDRTAIKELPSSLDRLVGLEELGLAYCYKLKTIPDSIGNLSKLCKLELTFCNSLETFPSSIFKLKLTKLSLYVCSMLSIFPEILEPVETLAHLNLSRTAIKELPSSLGYLVGLRTLCLNSCSDLASLPHSIGNLSHLSQLDCSGCCSLTEIPNSIGNLSSLSELSLQKSSIVNLPESIVHLSSLRSLDISDCKMLEFIPQLPPLLNQLPAFDCPSIKRVMSNSSLELPSNFKKDTFEFRLTNGQELDSTASPNIGAEAWLRINQDAYRSVFFRFPGSTVPYWFPYRSQGNSVTMKNDSPYMCNENRLVGFAMCVIWGCVDIDHNGASFTYKLTVESDGHTYTLPNNDKIKNYFYWNGPSRYVKQDQTFLWKYQLDHAYMDNMLFHAHSFAFEFNKHNRSVKECGICPLFAKEKDDKGDYNFLRFSNNEIEELGGSKSA